MFYSKSTFGFYSTEVRRENIPLDAVEITKENHAALLAGQALGKLIRPNGDGYPILVDRPSPTEKQLAVAARATRNELIAETDCMLLPDYMVSADRLIAIKMYRQSLRDITDQDGFPHTIDWPILVGLD